jgi:uncharacterized protein (AIM24 family)
MTAALGVISANSTSDALRITQVGTGNALIVEDEANPDATPFVITASGNVGIGTTTPAGKLDVAGDIISQTSLNGTGTFWFQSKKSRGTVDVPTTVLNGDGIGGLLAVAYQSSYRSYAAISFNINGTVSTNTVPTDIVFTALETGAPVGGSERMRIASTGNVGIGTTSPDDALHLANATSANFILEDSGAATNNAAQGKVEFQRSADVPFGGLYVTDGTVDLNISTKFSTGFLTFGTDTGTERMRITSTGNVGIGTTTPATRLHVSGTTTLDGGYTEKVFAITDGATVNLDPNNGSIQTWTLGAGRTPGQENWAAGQSITLMIDDGTANTITWTTLAPVWETNGGVAPTLATSGFTVIVLWKVATTIYGARVGDA